MEKEVIIDDDIKLKATSPESAAEEYALLIGSRDTILPWLKWLHSYDGLSPKEGVKARTEYQAEKLKQFEAGTNYAYDIYYKGKLTGSIEIKNISYAKHSCDIGYWLSKKFAGEGIMTRSVDALTALIFEKLNINHIIMNVAEDNLASRAVAERCGYAIEKTLHDYFSLDDGHHDCYVYGKRKKSGSTKTGARIGKFTVISIVLSVFNFLFYTLLARLFFKDNSWLWLDSAIACAATAILAYVLHSKITWKERPVSKRGLAMFFLWNGLLAFVICPFFTWVFGFIKPLYSFVFDVLSAIHLPIDYLLVESTVIFILTTIVVLILNYIFYDKLVFGNQKSSKK